MIFKRTMSYGISMSELKPHDLVGKKLLDIATDEEYLMLKFSGGLVFYIKSSAESNPILTAFVEEEKK